MVGDGIVIFGVREVAARRNLKSSTWIGACQRIRACTRGTSSGKLMAFAIDEIHFVDRRWIVGDRAAAKAAEIEVGIKNLAAIFAVSDRLKPDAFLKRDHLANR